ncbi:hypothetical protein WA026_017932 [Henosepilachna vigintioctopunctata]|uniref:Uncharacterized protein n=1 Tax=Henosepilachna vigintioctopunctata TaxID=420089 RepID=A0AAW1TVL8_9CUCU
MRPVLYFSRFLGNIILNNFGKNQIRNYTRQITGIVNLDENTLTGRLKIYLKSQNTNSSQNNEIFNAEEVFSEFRKGNVDLVNLPCNKLISFINSLESKEIVNSNREFYRILKQVDNESCSKQQYLTPVDFLNILDAYMELIPNKVTELKFYNIAIDYLNSVKDQLLKNEYFRFIFYISLMKKSAKSQKILRSTLRLLTNDNINQLSSEELCIIAYSTFKTSTKISNKNILAKIRNYLNDNLTLLKDPAIFVTLIKSLRQNRYCDEDLLATISCALFFNKSFELYTFQTYTHLLALYSDNLYYDDKLLEFVTKKCIEELKSYTTDKTGSKKIREKDIVRFVWGLSNLGSTHLKREDIQEVLIPKIIERIESSKFDLNARINIFHRLWILHYKCYELLPYIFESGNNLEEVLRNRNHKQKWNQLLTCIFHEDLPLFKKINIRPHGENSFYLPQHLKDRPCLENILRSLKYIGIKMDMKFEVGYQIPYMNILGITGYTKNIIKVVNIEVLDHFTTLKNTDNRPTGLMQMKLRILDGFEEALIVIKEKDLEQLTESEVEQFLQDELNLVC